MDSVSSDRVYSSRKFLLTIFCITLICAGGLLAAHIPSFVPLFPTYIGGILGALGLFITGNVSNDFLNNKVKATVQVENIKTNRTSITKETSTIEGPQPSVADLHQDGE